jgi:hypothetical protein
MAGEMLPQKCYICWWGLRRQNGQRGNETKENKVNRRRKDSKKRERNKP